MILVRGIPGSGKSTVAYTLKEILESVGKRDVGVFSTDNYWYRNDPSVYAWNPDEIGTAHKWNQSQVEMAINDGKHVIVDNTNLDGFALMPYFDMVVKYDLDVIIHTVDTPVETCIDRQRKRTPDRRVPDDVIRAMHKKFVANADLTVESQVEKAKIRSQIRNQIRSQLS